MNMSAARAEHLNHNCACESQGASDLAAFYSRAPVFVSTGHVRQMEALIAAIHRVIFLPGFQDAVLAEAPPIAGIPQATQGVFTGFDFHVGADGPKLIEINTNAGGAMLNTVAGWRHPDCCDDRNPGVRLSPGRVQLESDFIAMFHNEWRLARGDRPLTTIAIVDEQPAQQFLYAEFRLFERLFAAQGIDAVIVDAAELEFANGRLQARGRPIDLVYNRLTDFYFERPAHAALRDAYVDDAVVVTPHPRAHALLADKRNLVRLTDAGCLGSLGVPGADVDVLLAGIPLSLRVDDDERWWADRKAWFFKPAGGYGSRGAYRGDKLTRRVFGDLRRGDYIAQRLALPGERTVSSSAQRFKVDLRCYVYDGRTQLMAARLYQGQTTNFRTAGGGFAPVIELL